jgi:guanylate kinase
MFIFIAPPSLEALESRLRGRGTETEDKVRWKHKRKAEGGRHGARV